MSTPPSESSAAVVLATPTFTRWLTDESFMSALLGTFASRDMQVLAGVVDDIYAPTTSGNPVSGFSILQGPAECLLPSFNTPAAPSHGRNAPRPASVQFSLPRGASGSLLSLNMPLANTVFQNGRESTLLACTWKRTPHSAFALSHSIEKTRQDVALAGPPPSLSVPLIPVTPPRRIAGCLGNIISQIEIDGAAVPASTELENEVQGVYDRRAAAGNLNSEGMPVDIWALVSTPQGTVSAETEDVLDSLEEAEFDGPEEERAVAASNVPAVEKLLMSGFQLHRISTSPGYSVSRGDVSNTLPASGGGGWDKRRGRLSLDPTWSTSDSDPDLNMMLNTTDSGPAILQRGLVSPGSYIQFLTCPNPSRSRVAQPGASVVLGTSATRAGEEIGPGPDVECFWGHFGALSRRHFFLEGRGSQGRVRTQVDTPFSYLSI